MTRVLRHRWAVLVAAVALIGLGAAAPAVGAEAQGCSGKAISQDAGGLPVDKVTAPGPHGTEDDPFIVDPEGTVAWTGSTPTALKDGTWSVTVGGFPVRSGDVTNEEGVRTKSGESDLSDIPAFVSVWFKGGTVTPVQVDITTATGSCTATVYVSTATSPAFTPLWIAGLALLLLGVMILIAAIARMQPGSRAAGLALGEPPTRDV